MPGRVYVREKKAGVWGTWSIDGVGVVGPTPPADPPDGLLWWDNISGQLYVWYRDVDSAQWVIASPSPDPDQFILKGGGDTVTNIIITENLTITNPPVEDTDATNKKYVDDQDAALAAQINQDIVPILNGKVSKSGDTMSGYLTMVGPLTVTGDDIYARTGIVRFADGTSHYIQWDGAQFQINGPITASNYLTVGTVLTVNSGIIAAPNGSLALSPYGWNSNAGQAIIDFGGVSVHDGNFNPPSGRDGGFRCKQGDTNTLDDSWKYFNMFWTGSAMQIYLGQVVLGNVSITSDYRTKKDVVPLPSTWDAVRALKPIKYTQAEFAPLFVADNIEQWGFLAHELQETLVATAATGVKDQDNHIQSPNPMPVIAAH